MNVYELNQKCYESAPILSQKEIKETYLPIIIDFLNEHQSKYYMMLNNDTRYYTVYTCVDDFKPKKLAQEMIDVILESLGPIVDIVVNEYGGIEFWVRSEGIVNVYIFFNYEKGVIEI